MTQTWLCAHVITVLWRQMEGISFASYVSLLSELQV